MSQARRASTRLAKCGHPAASSAQSAASQARSFDSGTGLGFYNARYYDTVLGRFISPDSIVPDAAQPGLFNRFVYVSNNPLIYTDPTGHGPRCYWVGFTLVCVSKNDKPNPYNPFGSTDNSGLTDYDFDVPSGPQEAWDRLSCGVRSWFGSSCSSSGVSQEQEGQPTLDAGQQSTPASPDPNDPDDDRIRVPQVSDPKLQNILRDQIYKHVGQDGTIEDGTLAPAIKNEIATGKPTNGRWHIIKGRDNANGLRNWLNTNPGAPEWDRSVALNELRKLEQALEPLYPRGFWTSTLK